MTEDTDGRSRSNRGTADHEPTRRTPGGDRVAVRPGQRAHRPARLAWRRVSRTSSRAPTSTASTRSGRSPTPRPATASRSPGQTVVNVDRRQADPPASSATRPSTSATARSSHHERTLDLRAGRPGARTEWTAPNGASVRSPRERLVSFTERVSPRSRYEVDAARRRLLLRPPVRPAGQRAATARPRATLATRRVLTPTAAVRADRRPRDQRAVLVHRTTRSGLRVAAGMDHVITLPDGADHHHRSAERRPGPADIAASCRPGRPLQMVKLSPTAGRAGGRPRPCGTRSTPRWPLRGWPAGTAWPRSSGSYLDEFWERRDVEIEGDPALQQAVRVVDCSTCCRPARGPSARPSRPRA